MKKKILSLLLAAVLLMGVLPMTVISADATTNYDLWVGTTRVTSANASDILSDRNPANNLPTASFDAETNTLILNGAVVYETRQYLFAVSGSPFPIAVYADLADLTVGFVGENYVGAPVENVSLQTDPAYIGILSEGPLTIEGAEGATLTLAGYTAGAMAIDLNTNLYKNITVTGAGQVTLEGEVYAIGGQDILFVGGEVYADGGILHQGECIVAGETKKVYVTDGYYGPFQNESYLEPALAGFSVKGSHFSDASEEDVTGAVHWSREEGGYVMDDGSYYNAKTLLITPAPYEEYDLWVNGVQVTSKNAWDILNAWYSSGQSTASFNPATSTLKLCNAVLNEEHAKGGVSAGILSELPELTVEYAGDVILHAEDTVNSFGIYSLGDLTLTGGNKSTLTVTSKNIAIGTRGDLTVAGEGTLAATAADTQGYACGILVQTGDFYFTGGTVNASGTVFGLMLDQANLIVEGKAEELYLTGGEAAVVGQTLGTAPSVTAEYCAVTGSLLKEATAETLTAAAFDAAGTGETVGSLSDAYAYFIGDGRTAADVAKTVRVKDKTLPYYPFCTYTDGPSLVLELDIPGTNEGTVYQWQMAANTDSSFANVEDATASTLSVTASEGHVYRCIVDGSPTETVILTQEPDGDSPWYISNGTMAYGVWDSGCYFDIQGYYNGHWANTSWSGDWRVYSTNSLTPSAGSVPTSNLADTVLTFSPDDSRQVLVKFTVNEAGAVSFGADTELDDYDSCPLSAVHYLDGTLKQIQLVGASSLQTANVNTVSFVMRPLSNISHYWIGYYSSRETWAFNDQYGLGVTAVNKQGHAIEVNQQDSGMTMSWTNIPAGGTVGFAMCVGAVKDTGALISSIDITEEKVALVISDDTYVYRLVEVDGKVVNGPDAGSYDLGAGWVASDENGNLVFEGLKENTTYIIQAVPSGKIPSPSNIEEIKRLETARLTMNTGVDENGNSTTVKYTAACNTLTFYDLDTWNYEYVLQGPGLPYYGVDVYNGDAVEDLLADEEYTLTAYFEVNYAEMEAIPVTVKTLPHAYVWVPTVESQSVLVGTCKNGCGHQQKLAIAAPENWITQLFTQYTLSFDTNGGFPLPSVIERNGTAINLISYTTVREGYTFTGWYEDPELTTPVGSVTLKKNTTVYAGWKAEEQTPTPPFNDIAESDWFYEDAIYMYETGLMAPDETGAFGGETEVSRSEFVTILWLLAGKPEAVYTGTMLDVEKGSAIVPAMEWAAAYGIIGGDGEGNLFPGVAMSREQLAVMLYRLAVLMKYDTEVDEGHTLTCPDADKIADYAKEAMLWITGEGIMGGRDGGYMDPQAVAKRQEVAAVIHRFALRIIGAN